MLKNKRTFFVLFILFLLLFVGGVFLWQENQKDVVELNKNLPEGVRVVKSLIGEEYGIINKIDGYEFKIPDEWRGIEEIEYIPERTEEGYSGASISIEGKEGSGRLITIDRFKIKVPETDLEIWAKTEFETFGLVGEFSNSKIGNLEIVKTQENVHLFGMYVYFFQKNSAIYSVTCRSEDSIREIISNGKW